MSLTVRIDRLVLEGLPVTHRDRNALVAAVERELATRLRGDGRSWPTRGIAVRAIRGGRVEVAPGGRASALGSDVAGAIQTALGQVGAT